jgi:hypothetical protein
VVERGPEKAGVGGSIPSLATIQINNLEDINKSLRFPEAFDVWNESLYFQ